ncbi:MAG: membrane fusion protein (multidrug efflux system) [Alphaproteobacteria bacterium]
MVSETKFEIELIVPSHWLRTIGIGAAFKFTVDELGATYTGKLIRLGAAVDPVSQTIKIIGTFDTKPSKVLSGMSGSALFEGRGL